MPDSCKAIVQLVFNLEYIVRAFSKLQLVDILLRKIYLNLDLVSKSASSPIFRYRSLCLRNFSGMLAARGSSLCSRFHSQKQLAPICRSTGVPVRHSFQKYSSVNRICIFNNMLHQQNYDETSTENRIECWTSSYLVD